MIDSLLSYDHAWKPYSTGQSLDTDKTHVFRIDINNHFQKIKKGLADVLSEREQEKASRMFTQKDKERYVVSKFCLRSILSLCLNTSPQEIEFIFHEFRKPTVRGIEFNISHTGDYVMIAISPKAVGIDIEVINQEFDFKSILDITFSRNEIAFIGEKRVDPKNFYVMWTRKEALLKASGEGVSDNLHLIECLNEQLRWDEEIFKMRTFTIGDDYVASIATALDQKELILWNWV